MHVHLPKPLHGWRALFGEVGIIVLGVLIALGAEQIVVYLHDQHVAGQAEADIRADFAHDAALAVERIATGDCLRASLGDLQHRLTASGNSWPGLQNMAITGNARKSIVGTLYAFPRVFGPPRRLWRDSAWTTAMSTGALNPISRSNFARLAELHVMLGWFDRFNQRELEDYAGMMPLTIPLTLDSGTRLQLLTALSQVDTDNADIERLAAVFVTAAAQSGISPDRQWLDRTLPAQARVRGRCVRQGAALDRAIAAEGAGQR
jgi:hypothetical protein